MTNLTQPAQYAEYLTDTAATTTEFAAAALILTYALVVLAWLILAVLTIRILSK